MYARMRRRLMQALVCLSVMFTVRLYINRKQYSDHLIANQPSTEDKNPMQGRVVIVNSRYDLQNAAKSNTANSVTPTYVPELDKSKIFSGIRNTSQTTHSPTFEHKPANPESHRQDCVFPHFLLNDPDLAKFFKTSYPLSCGRNITLSDTEASIEEIPWTEVQNGTFYIRPETLRRYGAKITCECDFVSRVDDHRVNTTHVANCVSGSRLQSDFFKVQCQAANGAAQMNTMAGIVPSQDVIGRNRHIMNRRVGESDSGRSGVENELKGTTPPDQHQHQSAPTFPASQPLNVYMLGLDSISRITFQRKLPKSYKYLVSELDGVVLGGYNIVGDGTPQALIPILTGKTENELPLTRKRYKDANYVNVYPFIWNNYRDAGYVTLYGEDEYRAGTFTYRLKGFNAQPTDHYMRTFYVYAEQYFKEFRRHCIGLESHMAVHLRYVEHYWNAYPNVPKFAFQFHSALSHDDINLIGTADDDLLAHFRRFKVVP